MRQKTAKTKFPFNLTEEEYIFLKRLSTPLKIQDYLDTIPFNFEPSGETCMSPRRVLREQKAHCIEGGMLAYLALLLQGEKPRILNLKVDKRDDDHVVILYKRNGYWGAISKTNHAVLRFRDPVYKTVRELAMSYFHEYFLTKNGKKTMKGFSRPISLSRFGSSWVTAEDDLWEIAAYVYDAPTTKSVPQGNETYIKDATLLEQASAKMTLSQK